MTSNPTAEWEQLGSKFYRKIQLYTAVFDEDLELENYVVAGCICGGAIGMYLHSRCLFVYSILPVKSSCSQERLDICTLANCSLALYRDENKLQTFKSVESSKSSIDLYSCAGKLIRRLNWDKASIKGIGWSEEEKLLVVTADGTVRCYYDLQGDFTQFSLGNGADEHGVVDCKFVLVLPRLVVSCSSELDSTIQALSLFSPTTSSSPSRVTTNLGRLYWRHLRKEKFIVGR